MGGTHHPALKRLKQEDLKFKASLGGILRPASKGDLETPGDLSHKLLRKTPDFSFFLSPIK